MVELSPEKLCPYCAETIKAAAVKCRFCHSDLPDSQATPPPPPPPPSVEAPEDLESAASEETGSVQPARVPILASFRLLSGLLVVCMVLVLVAGFAWYRSENPDQGTSPDGVITSAQARDAGMAAAASLTQKVLSYDWKTLAADMKASQAVLAPSFRSEYTKAMDDVKAETVKNQVKLTAAVVATSIISASTKKVQALVFVNQVTTAKGSGNQRVDQNRVRVILTRDDGDWRVSQMDAF